MHLFASLLLATSTVSAGIPVELQPTEGEPRQVLLDRMDAEQLMFHTAETTDSETVPANALRQIRWPDAPAVAAAGSFQITLTDGSVLTAESYTVANGQAQIGWAGSKTPIAIPTDRIRAVRLGRFDAAIEKSWQELLARTVVADVVAVLRKNQTLDNVQGVLQDVTDEVVKFQFEGDSIDVRRTKVVGIAYYRPQTAPLPPERGTLTLTDGSSLRVDQLTAATDNSQSLASIRTVGGTELSVPVTFLRQFDLAGQSLTYLALLEPESNSFSPFLDQPPMNPVLSRWFAARMHPKKAADSLKLQVGGRLQPIDNSVTLHSRTELVYRLAGQYRRFHCLAGVDPELGIGQAQLTIVADGTNKIQQNLVAGEDAMPIGVDVTGVNRLTVIVDYGADSDIADHVILGDARLIK